MRPLKRTERSRNLILDAAEAAFREQDFDATSVEEIAQRAGLTRKTVYNLFAFKEEIVAQLLARAEARYYPPLRARISENHAALAILEDTLIGNARWCAANPNVAMQALAASADKPYTAPDSGNDAFIALVRDILALGQQQGVVRKDEDAGIMALFLLGAHAQTMRHMLATGSIQENKLKYVMRLLVEGIGARPASKEANAGQRAKRASKATARRRT